MPDRITWEGDHDTMTGYIYGEAEKFKVKTRAFEIRYLPGAWGLPTNNAPYVIAHRLPFRGIERKFGSVKLAQQHAERYLVWAMRLMGFQPIEADQEGDC